MNELRAYADGRWASFGGLQACPLTEADAQLGPRGAEQLHGGVFGGEPTQFALYPGGPAAPDGVTAWVLGDVVVGLEIRRPHPPAGALADLGEPSQERREVEEHELRERHRQGWHEARRLQNCCRRHQD